MNSGISSVFQLMTSIFNMLTSNPLFTALIGVIVVAFVVGIVTSVFSRRRGRSRR